MTPLWLLLNLTVFGQTAGASGDFKCEDFWTYTCSDRSKDDGTAIIPGVSQQLAKLTAENKALILKTIPAMIDEMLSSKKHKPFKDLLVEIETTFYPDSKNLCRSKNYYSKQCNDWLKSATLSILFLSQDSSYFKTLKSNETKFSKLQAQYLNSSELNTLTKTITAFKLPTAVIESLNLKISERAKTVKLILEEILQDEVKSKTSLDVVLSRIRNTSIDLESCRFNDPPAFYQNGRIKYCSSNLLKTNSEYHLIFHLAHELAHSIDPCIIAIDPSPGPTLPYSDGSYKVVLKENPFSRILELMKLSDHSSLLNPKHQSFKDSVVNTVNMPVCVFNQTYELFSDWMGAEVLSRYIVKFLSKASLNQNRVGFANLFSSSCGEIEDGRPSNRHPPSRLRLNKIFSSNSNAKKTVECASK